MTTLPSSSCSSLSTRRPLVVLAGWLGAQPRSMRRYQILYEEMGFAVETRIASPSLVIAASTTSNTAASSSYNDSNKAIRELAKEVYHTTQQYPCWFFHSFSNGGCFLWELVRNLVNENETASSSTTSSREKNRQCCKPSGVVFDSAPAYYEGHPEELYKVLAYCNWEERWRARLNILWGGSQMKQERKERSKEYWNSVLNDPSDTPQLFLASQNDALTPYQPLKELVQARQDRFGKDRIWWKEWESSPHCAHLLTHPVEYKSVIRDFCTTCIKKKDDGKLLSSKL